MTIIDDGVNFDIAPSHVFDSIQADVIVASHRRSGTHVMLHYLVDQMRLTVIKTHEFRDRVRPFPKVYLVRDPVECLWSTYRWFVDGDSSNQRITEALDGLTFEQYLRGAAGERVGFDSMTQPPRDSFREGRGMLFDPIRFWADHVRSFLRAEDSTLVVQYERLVADPIPEVARVCEHLGRPAPDDLEPLERTHLVGHAPSVDQAARALDQWTDVASAMLNARAGDLLERFGYSRHRRRTTGGATLRYACRDDHSGYGIAARRCLEAIAATGIDVVWEPQPRERAARGAPRAETPEELVARYRPKARVDTTVLHTMPEWWSVFRRQLGPGTYIGHTVWELEQLPSDWQGDLHAVDALWVPTEWNRRTFESEGVRRPISSVPHVITTDPVEEPPIEIPDGVTVFSTVASWHPRKRPDWAVEAYARAFRRDDPVLLIVKTDPRTDAWPATSDLEQMTWWQLLKVLRRHESPPEVMLVNERLSDAQVNGLLARSDCFVSLACSEGWGLGVFDAATLGTPVITTGYGGHLEYLGNDHPGLVPAVMMPVGEVANSPHFEPGMMWGEADLDIAAAMLREVVAGDSQAVVQAPAVAERLRITYSPEAVGQRVVSLLDRLM